MGRSAALLALPERQARANLSADVACEANAETRSIDSPESASAFGAALQRQRAAADELTQAGLAEGMATTQHPGAAIAIIVNLHANATTGLLQCHDCGVYSVGFQSTFVSMDRHQS